MDYGDQSLVILMSLRKTLEETYINNLIRNIKYLLIKIHYKATLVKIKIKYTTKYNNTKEALIFLVFGKEERMREKIIGNNVWHYIALFQGLHCFVFSSTQAKALIIMFKGKDKFSLQTWK